MRSRYSIEFHHLPIAQMLLGESFHPGGVQLTHKLAVKTQVNSRSVVLYIGSGKCLSTHYLAEQFGAHVFALDRGLEHLVGSRIGDKPDIKNKIHLIQGDTHHLPIASNSVDVVFCECVLGSFENRELALTEIYRVLKPQGKLAISDIFLNKILPIELHVEMNRWLRIAAAYNSIRCREAIRQGGFEQIRFKDASAQLLETIHTIETKMAIPDPRLSELIRQGAIIQRTNWQHGISRRLAQFIYDGGAGYYTLTASKPT